MNDMKINTIKQIFLQYSFALLGFIMLSYYIWFKVFRDRVPRNIPFEFSWGFFFIVFIIVVIYFYIIWRLYRPKAPSTYILYCLQYLQKLYQPLFILEQVTKNNLFIKKITNKLFLLGGHFVKRHKLYLDKPYFTFYFFFNFLLKFIILLLFFIDIFIFQQIKLFYYVIWLSIIPLIFKYLIHIIKEDLDKNFYIKVLSTDDDDNDYIVFPHSFINHAVFKEDDVTLLNYSRLFIELQGASLFLGFTLFKYDCVETWEARVAYAEKHNLELAPLYMPYPQNDDISKILAKDFNMLINPTINIYAFFNLQSCYKEKILNIEKSMNIFFSIGYLICWSYIFLISFVKFDIFMSFIVTVVNNLEPFSELNIQKDTMPNDLPSTSTFTV